MKWLFDYLEALCMLYSCGARWNEEVQKNKSGSLGQIYYCIALGHNFNNCNN